MLHLFITALIAPVIMPYLGDHLRQRRRRQKATSRILVIFVAHQFSLMGISTVLDAADQLFLRSMSTAPTPEGNQLSFLDEYSMYCSRTTSFSYSCSDPLCPPREISFRPMPCHETGHTSSPCRQKVDTSIYFIFQILAIKSSTIFSSSSCGST